MTDPNFGAAIAGHPLQGLLIAFGGALSRAGTSAAEAVAQRLARGVATVVVLDKFEHLVKRARDLVARWSAASRGVTILVTSREVLRVPGERALDVAPLSVPS